MIRLAASLFLLIAFYSTVHAGHPYTPETGTSERKAIMDAARTPIMKELADQQIQFVVRKLRVFNGWAYLEATPQLRGGKKVDYNITKFKDDIRQGFFDEWVGILLRGRGTRWSVQTYVIGATDYPVVGWPEQFGAPKALFEE